MQLSSSFINIQVSDQSTAATWSPQMVNDSKADEDSVFPIMEGTDELASAVSVCYLVVQLHTVLTQSGWLKYCLCGKERESTILLFFRMSMVWPCVDYSGGKASPHSDRIFRR